MGCAAAVACPQPASAGPSWSEKADMTWDEIFRFAFQKDLIPMLKELGAQLGREELVAMLREASAKAIEKKTAGRPPVIRDVATYAAMLKNLPPLFKHALDAEIVDQTVQSFEFRVKKCLWAKAFRNENAGDIGYAMICFPDYAVAKSLNPKLQLVRSKTLMQGDDLCGLKYVMET
jgi:hypothetical protein